MARRTDARRKANMELKVRRRPLVVCCFGVMRRVPSLCASVRMNQR
jgi:hypothetical protein